MEAHASAWDRLQAEWSSLVGELPSRTAPYDELHARVRELTPAADAYPAASLAREHARRVRYWAERLASQPGLADKGADQRRRRNALKATTFAGILGALALVGLVWWRDSAPLAMLAAAAVGASIAIYLCAARAAAKPELGQALAGALCPDCGYSLRGLPPALPVHALAGLDVGPETCPECGRRWPRVPPPAPIAQDPEDG